MSPKAGGCKHHDVYPLSALAVETVFLTEGTWGNMAYGVQSLPILQVASVLGLNDILFLMYWTAAVANEIWEGSSRRLARNAVAVGLDMRIWNCHSNYPVRATDVQNRASRVVSS